MKMGRYDRLLDKVITVLGGNGCIEGSHTDLHVQRLIKIYSRPQSKILQHHHEEEITGGFTTIEPTTVDNVELTVFEQTAMEDAEQTPMEIASVGVSPYL